MVWPLGELQAFYKVTSSCLWGWGGEGEREKGKERGWERGRERRREGGRRRRRERRDLSTSYSRDLLLISNMPEIVILIAIW